MSKRNQEQRNPSAGTGEPFSDGTFFTDGAGFKPPHGDKELEPAPAKDADSSDLTDLSGDERVSKLNKRSGNSIEYVLVYIFERLSRLFQGLKRFIGFGEITHKNTSPLKCVFTGDVAGRALHWRGPHQPYHPRNNPQVSRA